MAYFCGLWFQWQFNFQQLCRVFLVCLVFLVLQVLPEGNEYLWVEGCGGPLLGPPKPLPHYPAVSGWGRRVLGCRDKEAS